MTEHAAMRIEDERARGYGIVHLSVARTVIELRQFFRSPQLVFFTFSLPVLLLVLFATIFSGNIEGPPGVQPVPFRQYFIAGMVAAGIVSTTFTSLAITIAIERHEGLLKRLSGTPLPKSAYFAGKIGLAVVSSAIQTALMLTVGVVFFGLTLPADPMRWLVFGWVFVLGISACCLLGISYTRLIPSGQSAAAIVQPPYLVLQFISGVFFVFSDLPRVLQVVAVVFPLKWMAQGFRYVFLPGWFQVKEQGGVWHLDFIALALGGWTIAGFLLAVRLFRWTQESDL
ncbi:MAG: ABC transporter permease [Dehalococcoidia bacterium]